MPFIKRVGPLPDGHPLKGTQIIFGMKRPESSEKKLTKGGADYGCID
jgi:hypothetical protein